MLFRFNDPEITFSNKVISFIPVLRHVPPISRYNKKLVNQVQSVLGNFSCMKQIK